MCSLMHTQILFQTKDSAKEKRVNLKDNFFPELNTFQLKVERPRPEGLRLIVFKVIGVIKIEIEIIEVEVIKIKVIEIEVIEIEVTKIKVIKIEVIFTNIKLKLESILLSL